MSKEDPEFKNPKRTKQVDLEAEERKAQTQKAGEIYEAWKTSRINTPARTGKEVIASLFFLRDLMIKNITNQHVLDLQLQQIDISLKKANEHWPEKSGKATKARRRSAWSDSAATKDSSRRSTRPPSGPGSGPASPTDASRN